MAGLHFDATLENSGFIRKLEEIKKGIQETSKLIEEGEKRIDSINQKFEAFDEEVLKMCGNLNKYFDGLLSKVESMASMLQVGKVELSAPTVKSDGTSTQQLEELRSRNAELTAELEKQRAEIEHQQEEWNKLATAIKSNNVSAIEQYKQAIISSNTSVKDAKSELKGLSKELDDNLKYYDKLAVQAATYKEELVKLQDAQAKGIARVVTGANGTSMPVNNEIDRLKNSLNEVRENQKGVSQEISAQRQRQIELNTVIEQGNEKHARTRTLIMDAREQMIQMRAAGMQNTIQYQQAGEELGKMRLQMKLVNAEMEFLANPNKGLATLKAGLSGAATSASLVVGIIGLFNDKSEKMAELQTKIQSLMAVVVGLEGTYGMLKKSNTMMLAIENVRRRATIASMALETKAKTTNIALTWSEVAAQKAFNIVAKANPYVLLAAAILTVVGGVWLLVNANKENVNTQERVNKVLEEQKEHYDGVKNKVNSLVSIIRDEASTRFDMVRAYKQLQNIMPGVFKNMDIETIKLMNKLGLLKDINKEANKSEIIGAKTKVIMAQNEVDKINALIKSDSERGTYSGQYEIQLDKAKNDLSTAQKVLFELEKIQTEADKDKDKIKIHNKDFWITQLQDAETAISAIESSQLELLKKATKDPKKDLYRLGIDKSVVDSYKKNIKLKSEAEKQLKIYNDSSKEQRTAEKEAEKLKKEQEKRNEELLTLQRNNQKSEIDLMEKGSKKKIAQIELDYKNEIAAIKKQEEKWSKAQDGKLTEKQSQEISIAYTQAEDKKDKGVSDVKKETQKEESERLKAAQSAWNEYYQTYGTWEQKRLALAKEYQQKIKEVQNDKNKSGDEKNALIATLQKEWDEALANLNLDKLKQDINWEVVFGDMSKVAKKQLQQVKKQLQEFKKSPEFKTSTPEQIKVIEEALNNINTALVDKGGFFGGLTDSLTEYEGTVYKVKEAQEELEKALKSGDEVAIEKAKKKKNAAEQNQANAQANVEKSKDKAISNITAVSNAIVQLGKENVSLSDIGNTVGTLVDALSSSGTKIGGIISAILSIIDAAGEVGTFQYGMDIIENISSTVTDAFARDTESITGLDMSFMKSADYDDYNELVEQYDTLIDVWDQLLDKKKAYIKESYGIEATKAGQEALDLLNSERKITRELASSRLDAGASSGSHSMNYRMWKGSYDYNGTNWKDVAGDISKSLGGVDFSSMWSMLDMSSEQLEWIKINYSGLWASMDGDFRGYLDDIIQYGDTEKEILKSINEQLTQTSFDSLFDSFLNTLMDMDASSKDFADSFEEYMRKAIFTSMFAKNYEDELTKWYEAFAEANKKEEGITEDDVKNLRNRWDNIVNGALSDREAWEKIVGSSGSESSREASKKGLATASQDSVDELNGRFTVIQGHTYEINSSVKVIQSDTAKIAEKLSFLTSMDKNMSDMVRGHDIIVAHLSNIEGYTANLVDIRQFMYFMKLGIDSLNTKGITLKR